MDVQGYEAVILRGMRAVIARNPSLVLFTEFWPEGLRLAGSDPRAFLEHLASLGFSISEISEKSRRLEPVQDFEALIGKTPGRHYTNLCCQRLGVRPSSSEAISRW